MKVKDYVEFIDTSKLKPLNDRIGRIIAVRNGLLTIQYLYYTGLWANDIMTWKMDRVELSPNEVKLHKETDCTLEITDLYGIYDNETV